MRRWVGWALVIALLRPVAVAAQQQPLTLDNVEELARMGRTESAREALRRWWDRSSAEASRRDAQRALWLRGRLTMDPDEASIDFRRLVVEYPGGPYSDLALLRLAQAAFAQGDSTQAARDVGRLAQEYPSSPVRREAQAWLASAGPPPPPPVRPVRVAPPDSSPRQAAGATGPFSVQLGAFADRGRAEALRRRASETGLDVRLATLPGSELVRVRVGRFDSSEEAHAILERVQGLGFTATVVGDANREERSGG
jgi:cell division protein FtsN